ncbi:MAG TPA: PqqD family peptide modification chaperone [Quisquiliibacterium sp.]|nr:PqqD family peptide modification chaperone [Quisquiliibacterium sp.]HQN10758.1 PqqD family peptide modification chaperone [Quisquiliibacterium sp.]
MGSGVFSQHWHRVADLHPRVRSHVQVDRHCYRGQIWHVLKDRVSGRQHRLNEVAWSVVGRLDGRRSVQTIWEAALHDLGDDAPSQPEVVDLLARLHAAELIATEASADVAAIFDRRDARMRRARSQRINPLAFRVPLFDPTSLLDLLAPLGRLFARPWMLVVWALLAVLSLVAAGSHAGTLAAYAHQRLATPGMLFTLWLCYPLVKTIHETAHALAVRNWGGEVHEVGVTLLVLTPVPYVDASAASGFRQKSRRIAVSLAGIIAELVLAALAFWAWLHMSDGPLRQGAFAVMMIGTVSTLLFNGNPLMRFDAYYALADALEIPGLATRSNAWLLRRAEHLLFGVADVTAATVSRAERAWLTAYGVASALYRWVISAVILTWLAGISFVLAVPAGALVAWQLALRPFARFVDYLAKSPRLARARLRAVAVSTAGVAALLVAVFVVPLPFSTVAPGVVWVPEQARVRAGVDGFVERVLAADGAEVREGQPIVQMSEPQLLADWNRAGARLAALDAAYQAALGRNAAEARQIADEIERARSDAGVLLERIGRLTVRSPADGRLALPKPQDLEGAYLAHGTLVAHTLSPTLLRVRVALEQNDAGLVREQTRAVTVRMAEHGLLRMPARLAGDIPAATRELPSPALGDRSGGPFMTDPADADGIRVLDPVFIADLEVEGILLERVGGRVWVRFDHGAAPLGTQAWRRLRQVFLRLLSGDRPALAVGV